MSKENVIKDKIELLNAELLNDFDKIKIIDHWLSVLNWPNGWHYDLDIIWILQHIELCRLPKGAVILDAGAGLGIMQFLLAASGYNVISLDFTSRQIPLFSKGIFVIKNIERDLGAYAHEYMSFMNYGLNQKVGLAKRGGLLSLVKKLANMRNFEANVFRLRSGFKQRFNISYFLEKMRDHSAFGKITFLRGTFNDIPLEAGTVDALVSVSAFEHNTYKDMPESITEFLRVMRKGALAFITTSAAEHEDWYFEPPKAWNFTRETLIRWFQIPETAVSFDYSNAFQGIAHSNVLRRRISSFYKFSGENGLPYGNLNMMRYLPVGILKTKE
jgi:ubiquinone/menaquinone biosynthesis C-methylase UbiE